MKINGKWKVKSEMGRRKPACRQAGRNTEVFLKSRIAVVLR